MEIETLSSEEESIIEELRPKRFAHDVVPLAYRNDAIFGRISGIQSRSGADACLYTVTLNPEQLDYGGNFMEMGTRGLTVNQIAELRARRILLNDSLTLKNETVMDTMIEVLVRGTQMPISVTESPIPRLYRELSSRPDQFLPCARLTAIVFLKGSGVVERVRTLKVGPIRNDKLHIVFQGVRRKVYTNAPPHEITVEGECALD